VAIKIHKREDGSFWLVFTDLTIGLFTLFIMVFIALAALKNQRELEYKNLMTLKKQQEEQMHELEKQRIALLSESLAKPLEKGLIAISDGNIHIQASLLFPTGRAEITEEGKELLSLIAAGLQSTLDTAELIMVSGFTDDQPIRSSQYTNWELSTERATNVVRHLTSKGFPPARIFAAGFGEHYPKVANTTEENRSINRRVEIGVAPIRKTRFINRAIN
jgi:flagellar motor protein MotB